MKGRFAPSPSGRMHIGNIFTALISWLSAKKQGGQWILRIEDLDRQRSKQEFIDYIFDDLLWLGLEPDEGGKEDKGPSSPYMQSRRSEIYEQAFNKFVSEGLVYPCYCTRKELNISSAPHETDGRIIYPGICRPVSENMILEQTGGPALTDRTIRSFRIKVPDRNISFHDKIFGDVTVNLSKHCGDFILRRGDGEWAYQLAVVIDDALMGVTEVVRGCDLLLSAAQQIYLYDLLGFKVPEYLHLPMLCNERGERLSKRDKSLDMSRLRKDFTPSGLIGFLGYFAGILPEPFPISAEGLLQLYSPSVIPPKKNIIID